MAGKLRALLTASGATCAVVAMAPGFVIAFLGVVLGPLVQYKKNLIMLQYQRAYIRFYIQHLTTTDTLIASL